MQKEKANLLLITPAWPTQSWHPLQLQLTVQIPLLLPKKQNILLEANREKHPLIEQENLQLLAWTVSGKNYMQKEFWETLPLLSQIPEDPVEMLITNQPGVSGIAGVSQKQVDLIKCSVNKTLLFLTECLNGL